MTSQEVTIGISVLTVVSGAINVYVGLRLAALQAQIKADSAAAEIALVKQFVEWKDDVLQLLNGKYVTAVLVAEIRTGIAHDVSRIERVLDLSSADVRSGVRLAASSTHRQKNSTNSAAVTRCL